MIITVTVAFNDHLDVVSRKVFELKHFYPISAFLVAPYFTYAT